MFVQVIQGKTTQPGELVAAFDRWEADLAPGATGWLGSTGGVTEDGRFIAVARFESEQAAMANSGRTEQDAWWAETAKLLDGEATFRNSTEVDVDARGDLDRAGFVQIIQGRSREPERVRRLMTEDADRWAEARPDIIGSVTVSHGEDAYTTVVYFTSEAEAREGERKQLAPDLQAQMDEMQRLNIGDPEFFDLEQPILSSPD